MTSESKVPRPPRTLGKAGRRLWRTVHEKFDLEGHERELLAEACGILDTCAALEDVIGEEGVTSVGSTGQRVTHPCVLELRQQRIAFARLLAQLGLPDVEGGSTVLSGHQARSQAGHRARWTPPRTPDRPTRGV